MLRLFSVLIRSFTAVLKSQRELTLENLALRHQLAVLRASSQRRLALTDFDRALWVALRRRWARWRQVLVIVKPETVVRWHREGFRRYWRRKSHPRRGRPKMAPEIRSLIRRISLANPLWGAPRVHGELLKLGIGISETSVAKYMPRRRPPSQTWRVFLDNHAKDLVAIDFFTVPTATFQVLFVFLVLAHNRRRVLHFNVTDNPTAEWAAHQIVEAFPWETAPRYLLRDRDSVYGQHFRDRVAACGIAEVLIAPRSPWQNPYVERLIGSIRRELLDHVIVLGERHLRRLLADYLDYYHRSRTHLPPGQRPAGAKTCRAARAGRGRRAARSRRAPSPMRTPRGLASLRYSSSPA